MAIGLLTRNKKQWAVYWGNMASDGKGGYTFDPPIEMKVRAAEMEEEQVDSFGETFMSQMIVLPAEDLTRGTAGWGFFWVGHRLADLPADSKEPKHIAEAMKIRQYRKSPTFRGTQYLRKAWM